MTDAEGGIFEKKIGHISCCDKFVQDPNSKISL